MPATVSVNRSVLFEFTIFLHLSYIKDSIPDTSVLSVQVRGGSSAEEAEEAEEGVQAPIWCCDEGGEAGELLVS